METLKNNVLKKSVENKGEVVILIVNSDERNLSITKIVLERGLPEYKIFSASNALVAINILVTHEVSLVILDADYNGLEMLQRLREDERFKEVPVMMMSGSTERETVASVFSLGVKDYITKPCAPKDLVARVSKLLDPNKEVDTAPVTAAKEPERMRGGTFRILLVDDDIFDLRQERDLLQSRLPCEITTAQSAAEGMKLLENQGADLVLVSLDMPFVSGLRFFALIKNNKKLNHIPVIIMTATRDFTVVTEIDKSGAAGYIRKPNISEDGLALIESNLRKRR